MIIIKKTELIQVDFSLEDPDVKKREFRALSATINYLKLTYATIIKFNEESSKKIDGLAINIIPAWKWLLS